MAATYTNTVNYTIPWVVHAGGAITSYTNYVYALNITGTAGLYDTEITQVNPLATTTNTITLFSFTITPPTASPATSATSQASSTPPASTPASESTSLGSTARPGRASSSISSTSSPTASNTHAPSKGVQPGAAAGIGIGCAIVGAIIAFALAFCLLRRRRGTANQPEPRQDSFRQALVGEKGHSGLTSATAARLERSNTQNTINASLPLPLQDREIGSHMGRFGNAIKNHAQSYYSGNAPTNLSDAVKEEITTLLGQNSYFDSRTVVALLSNPQTRTAAIRFLLGWSILRQADCVVPSDMTILPPEVVRCIESMRAQQSNSDAQTLMISKWRQMTASLMQPSYNTDVIPTKDSRQQNIRALVRALDIVLQPLASGRDEPDRQKGLDELVKRGARFGYMLFTQPTDWIFDWERYKSRQRGEMVVFPALSQASDEEGRKIINPQPLSEAYTVRTAAELP